MVIYNNELILAISGQINRFEINEAPQITTQSIEVEEDNTLIQPLAVTNIENDTLTFTVIEAATNGVIEINDNSELTYIPSADYFGEDSVNIQVTDQYGGDSQQVISIKVNAINDEPVANELSVNGVTSTQISGQVRATDIDSESLKFILVAGVSNGTLTFNIDGSFNYQSFSEFIGEDSFTYKVSELTLFSSQVTVKISVKPEPPKIETSSSGGSMTPFMMLILFTLSIMQLKNTREYAAEII